MAYCPECFTEYTEGTAECLDCGIELRQGDPPSDGPASGKDSHVKLVRIRTFSGPTAQLDAELARNILREEDIPCVLPGQFSAETLPGVDGVQVLVRSEDAEQASEILESFFNNPDSAAEE